MADLSSETVSVAPVYLDWFGCATFRLTIGPLVVFLDAYIDRVKGADGPGIVTEQITTADWILVGHSHFDHLYGAERIARQTGATIVGSYETVRVMHKLGVPSVQLLPVSGGERVDLGSGITAQVFPSLHSCVWAHAHGPSPDECCAGDLGIVHQERLARLRKVTASRSDTDNAAIAAHRKASDQRVLGDGGPLVFLIATPQGSLLFQDTAGSWSGMLHQCQPDVAILAAFGRGNVDGEPVQGSLAQFVAWEAAELAADRVILCHHDNWLPGRGISPEPIRQEMAAAAPRSELVEIGYLSHYPIFEGLRRQPSPANAGQEAGDRSTGDRVPFA